MPNTVENLKQTKCSTLLQTSVPRQGTTQETFIPKDFSFTEFLDLMNILNPKHFRVTKRKEQINILFAINKRAAFFARADTFSMAFEKLYHIILRKTT